MKRVVLLAVLLAACTGSETPDNRRPTTTHHLKVGLLTPGSVNDNGWNAIAYEGLQQIERQLGAEISNQETKTPAEFEEGFRSYGARGFDLAFGHGFEFQDAALAAGREYPKTIFITTSGSSVAKNVAPMVF
ncbi:MAG TPA: BMP family ABC transporter substrate-binding protein, partial [Thermoanaerobaculia bacterium]